MEISVKDFLKLNTSNQIKLLKKGEFKNLHKKERIEFIKNILKSELSSKTIASALKILRELDYSDKYFFRKFLYHVDSSVSNAARKAISESIDRKDSKTIKTIEILKREKGDKRINIIKSMLKDKRRININVLITLLGFDESRVREVVVKIVSKWDFLNESKIADAVKSSVWYSRASLIEILGNRKSAHLFDIIELLLNDPNVEVKLKLIEALSKYDRDKVREYLQRLTTDSILWVRKEAEKVLSTI